jgi:hypothetical protein
MRLAGWNPTFCLLALAGGWSACSSSGFVPDAGAGGHVGGTGGGNSGSAGAAGSAGGANVGGTAGHSNLAGAAGSNNLAGAAGGGNAGGVGGHVDAGTDASGGASGAGGMIPLPGCLQQLQASCPIAPSCSAPSVDAGGFVRVCSSGSAQCAVDAGPPLQQQVRKADGSLCYTLKTEITLFAACEYAAYTWTDADGNVVARGGLSNIGVPAVLTIACASEAGSNDSISCNPASPGCLNPATRLSSACPCATP